MNAQDSRTRAPLWVLAAVIVVIGAGLALPAGRRLAGRLLGSLRMDKVQAVNVNLSQFTGPNANHSLQQMVTQMISDNVKTTVSEKPQAAATATAAARIAGFSVELLGARSDAPRLMVTGERGFQMTVDRARLQAIFDEAGRHDLTVPAAVNGAEVAVRIPRAVVARYGTCPGRPNAAANVATPPPPTTAYADCVILREGPSPVVRVPADLDLAQLTQIGLELAGMSPAQSQQFLQKVDWRSMLGVSFPRFMRSYQVASVNGARATLLTLSGRRGPNYALFWARKGVDYSLSGYGDSGQAVQLAESVR